MGGPNATTEACRLAHAQAARAARRPSNGRVAPGNVGGVDVPWRDGQEQQSDHERPCAREGVVLARPQTGAGAQAIRR